MTEYKCTMCEKVFKQQNKYISHVSKHTIVKPPIKWIGGKTQILNKILDMFPTEINNYHEPFLGGGSVLLGLLNYAEIGKIKLSGKIYASDFNPNLIGLYKNIQKYPEQLVDEVDKLISEFSMCNGSIVNRKPTTLQEAMTSRESYYFWIRTKFNNLPTTSRGSIEASSKFLFINKTCFRGMYREGPHGFNVPYGNYKNLQIIDREHILTISKLIKNVVFKTCSFDVSLSKITSGDFVYLDPQYAPEMKTSFVGYNSDGFDIDKHKLLFKLCNDMTEKNVKMLMSNADVELVRGSFPNPQYVTEVISCKRSINSKDPSSRANEVLIVNYRRTM